jgi:hypothetical protein
VVAVSLGGEGGGEGGHHQSLSGLLERSFAELGWGTFSPCEHLDLLQAHHLQVEGHKTVGTMITQLGQ